MSYGNDDTTETPMINHQVTVTIDQTTRNMRFRTRRALAETLAYYGVAPSSQRSYQGQLSLASGTYVVTWGPADQQAETPAVPAPRAQTRPQAPASAPRAATSNVWAPVDALRTQAVAHLRHETRQGGTHKRQGHFAVTVGGTLRFVRVKQILSGRYAGRVFVDSMGSDTAYPVRRPDTLTAYLSAILVDPEAAAKRYADELGQCSDCGRPLTNEESRARGVGPECWSRR